MTIPEFSDSFATLLNSNSIRSTYGIPASLGTVTLDEYEKSVFLTQAQEEVVINLYNGKNPYGDSFESTEEIRRYLEELVKTKAFNVEDQQTIENKVSKDSIFFKLPSDIAFITFEQVTFADDNLGCYNGETADVYPVTQDEYNRISRNPFRGATRYRVLRMDTGETNVELISKYKIGKYLIKYLSIPSPIILENLEGEGVEIRGKTQKTPCKLNPILHDTILKRAVQLALTSRYTNLKGNGES